MVAVAAVAVAADVLGEAIVDACAQSNSSRVITASIIIVVVRLLDATDAVCGTVACTSIASVLKWWYSVRYVVTGRFLNSVGSHCV